MRGNDPDWDALLILSRAKVAVVQEGVDRTHKLAAAVVADVPQDLWPSVDLGDLMSAWSTCHGAWKYVLRKMASGEAK